MSSQYFSCNVLYNDSQPFKTAGFSAILPPSDTLSVLKSQISQLYQLLSPGSQSDPAICNPWDDQNGNDTIENRDTVSETANQLIVRFAVALERRLKQFESLTPQSSLNEIDPINRPIQPDEVIVSSAEKAVVEDLIGLKVISRPLKFEPSQTKPIQSNVRLTSGKWMFEVTLFDSTGFPAIGWGFRGADGREDAISWQCPNQMTFPFGPPSTTYPIDKFQTNIGDIIGCYIDIDVLEISYSLNGVMLPTRKIFPTTPHINPTLPSRSQHFIETADANGNPSVIIGCNLPDKYHIFPYVLPAAPKATTVLANFGGLPFVTSRPGYLPVQSQIKAHQRTQQADLILSIMDRLLPHFAKNIIQPKTTKVTPTKKWERGTRPESYLKMVLPGDTLEESHLRSLLNVVVNSNFGFKAIFTKSAISNTQSNHVLNDHSELHSTKLEQYGPESEQDHEQQDEQQLENVLPIEQTQESPIYDYIIQSSLIPYLKKIFVVSSPYYPDKNSRLHMFEEMVRWIDDQSWINQFFLSLFHNLSFHIIQTDIGMPVLNKEGVVLRESGHGLISNKIICAMVDSPWFCDIICNSPHFEMAIKSMFVPRAYDATIRIKPYVTRETLAELVRGPPSACSFISSRSDLTSGLAHRVALLGKLCYGLARYTPNWISESKEPFSPGYYTPPFLKFLSLTIASNIGGLKSVPNETEYKPYLALLTSALWNAIGRSTSVFSSLDCLAFGDFLQLDSVKNIDRLGGTYSHVAAKHPNPHNRSAWTPSIPNSALGDTVPSPQYAYRAKMNATAYHCSMMRQEYQSSLEKKASQELLLAEPTPTNDIPSSSNGNLPSVTDPAEHSPPPLEVDHSLTNGFTGKSHDSEVGNVNLRNNTEIFPEGDVNSNDSLLSGSSFESSSNDPTLFFRSATIEKEKAELDAFEKQLTAQWRNASTCWEFAFLDTSIYLFCIAFVPLITSLVNLSHQISMHTEIAGHISGVSFPAYVPSTPLRLFQASNRSEREENNVRLALRGLQVADEKRLSMFADMATHLAALLLRLSTDTKGSPWIHYVPELYVTTLISLTDEAVSGHMSWLPFVDIAPDWASSPCYFHPQEPVAFYVVWKALLTLLENGQVINPVLQIKIMSVVCSQFATGVQTATWSYSNDIIYQYFKVAFIQFTNPKSYIWTTILDAMFCMVDSTTPTTGVRIRYLGVFERFLNDDHNNHIVDSMLNSLFNWIAWTLNELEVAIDNYLTMLKLFSSNLDSITGEFHSKTQLAGADTSVMEARSMEERGLISDYLRPSWKTVQISNGRYLIELPSDPVSRIGILTELHGLSNNLHSASSDIPSYYLVMLTLINFASALHFHSPKLYSRGVNDTRLSETVSHLLPRIFGTQASPIVKLSRLLGTTVAPGTHLNQHSNAGNLGFFKFDPGMALVSLATLLSVTIRDEKLRPRFISLTAGTVPDDVVDRYLTLTMEGYYLTLDQNYWPLVKEHLPAIKAPQARTLLRSMDEECPICFTNPVNATFQPCNHRSCMSCIQRHLLNNDKCFFCKAIITSVVAD